MWVSFCGLRWFDEQRCYDVDGCQAAALADWLQALTD
jgi:hypothetical protein